MHHSFESSRVKLWLMRISLPGKAARSHLASWKCSPVIHSCRGLEGSCALFLLLLSLCLSMCYLHGLTSFLLITSSQPHWSLASGPWQTKPLPVSKPPDPAVHPSSQSRLLLILWDSAQLSSHPASSDPFTLSFYPVYFLLTLTITYIYFNFKLHLFTYTWILSPVSSLSLYAFISSNLNSVNFFKRFLYVGHFKVFFCCLLFLFVTILFLFQGLSFGCEACGALALPPRTEPVHSSRWKAKS